MKYIHYMNKMNKSIGIGLITIAVIFFFFSVFAFRTLFHKQSKPYQMDLLNVSLDQHVFHKSYQPIQYGTESIYTQRTLEQKHHTPQECISPTPPTESTTRTPPTESTTRTPPTESTTRTPPTDSTTRTPPTESTTRTPPTESTTRTPPTESTTRAPPTDSTTRTPPTDSTTRAPPTELKVKVKETTDRILGETTTLTTPSTISPSTSQLTTTLSSLKPEKLINITPDGFKIISV